MTRYLLWIALMLVGCPSKGESAAAVSTGVTTTTGAPTSGGTSGGYCGDPMLAIGWTDADGAPPSDTDGDGAHDQDCSSDTLDISIDCVDELELGMSESGTNGWTGEDCLNGFGGYQLCHPIAGRDQLVEVCTPAEVVPGETTLLDYSRDPQLTYLLIIEGDCFVTGEDPSYYDILGCEVLF